MASACPRCGFEYGWDGTNCSHCRHPIAVPVEIARDDLREIGFVSRAGNHGTPESKTWLFRDLDQETRTMITDLIGDRSVGRPVLVFMDSGSRWTLLTTRRVISWYEEQLHEASIDELVSVGPDSRPPRSCTNEDMDMWSGSLEYLRLRDYSGETLIWAPRGEKVFALWSILKQSERPR
jgi:hypothetical protein